MAEGDVRVPSSAKAALGHGFLTDIWYFVGLARDLKPGRIEGRELLGERVVIGRTRAGEAFVLGDLCPHRGALLSAGSLHTETDGTQTVECPYHGWRYGPDGACRAIPSLAREADMDVSRIRVRRYPVAESQGLTFAWVSSDPRFAGEPP